jgi:two-component system, response regulator YesN
MRVMKIYRKFHTLFIPIALSFLVLILVVSGFFIFYINRQLVSFIYLSEVHNLRKAGRTTELLIERSQVLAQQVHNDFQLKKLLYYEEIEQLDELISLQQLKSYSLVIPDLHSIYLYNEKQEQFYIVTEAKIQLVQSIGSFFDRDIINLMRDKGVVNSGRPVTRDISGEGVFTFLFHALGKRAELPVSTIVINISETWLQKQIEASSITDYQETVVMNDEGDIIMGRNSEAWQELSSKGYTERIRRVINEGEQEEGSQEGFFLSKENEERDLVTYYYRSDLGWIFIRKTPYKDIIRPVLTIRNVTLLVTSLFVLVTILVSFLISRRIFAPIREAAFYTEELERKDEETSTVINKELLHSFLLEPNHTAAESLFRTIEGLQFAIDLKRPVYTLLLSPDPDTFGNESIIGSKSKLSLKAEIELIQSIIDKDYPCETFSFKGGVLFSLINPPTEQNISPLELRAKSEEVIKVLARELDSSFSVVFNPSPLTISQAASTISLLEDAMGNRFIFGAGSVIDLAEMNERKHISLEVDKKEEDEIISSILNAQYERAVEICMGILDRAKAGTYRTIHTVYTILFSTIYKGIERIEQPSVTQFPVTFSTVLQDAANCANMAELKEYFTSIIFSIEKSLNNTTDTRKEQIVLAIQRIIKQRFNDYNLSSIVISEELGLSAPYVGRIFNVQTGHSLPKYINDYRIEKAKELLKTTELSIQTILEKTGYNNPSNFYYVFRKASGLTPKAFRWKYRVE